MCRGSEWSGPTLTCAPLNLCTSFQIDGEHAAARGAGVQARAGAVQRPDVLVGQPVVEGGPRLSAVGGAMHAVAAGNVCVSFPVDDHALELLLLQSLAGEAECRAAVLG